MIWIGMVFVLWLAARALAIEPPRTVVLSPVGYRLPELCHFRRLFNIDCPGCGMTRSCILASRLQMGEAWQMNPAGTMLFTSLLLSVPIRVVQWARVRQGHMVRSTFAVEACWLVVIAAVMMLRWTMATFC